MVLEKGDMLYIPPGYPHRGETITTALSYSIGFRAPSQQELMSGLADHLLDTNTGLQRFISANEPEFPASLSIDHQTGILDLLKDLLAQPQHYQQMLGQLLSQNRFELDLCEPEQDYSTADLTSALSEGAQLVRIGGLKVISLEDDTQSRLFINGEEFKLNIDQDELSYIANQMSLDNDKVLGLIRSAEVTKFLLTMLNLGYYYLA